MNHLLFRNTQNHLVNMKNITELKIQDACRICGSMKGSLILTKGHRGFVSRWIRCDGCQSARMDPYPNDDEITRYYNSKYLSMGSLDENNLGVSHEMRFSDAYKETVFNEYNYSCKDVALDVVNLCEDQLILDYGCANGIFLDYLYQCGCSKDKLFGFDIGVDMVSEAVSNGFNCTTHLTHLEESHFDLITAWDVLEHVSYPKVVVQQRTAYYT